MLFLDPGNSNYKARSSKGREVKTLSVIAKPKDDYSVKPLWKIDNHFVGENAIRYGHTQVYSLNKIKTDQNTFQILTKYILCNFKGEDKIVFLFPFDTYSSQKKQVVELFGKQQDIIYNIGNEQYTYNFKPILVKSLPQGLTTGMDYYLGDDGKPRRDIPNVVLIIDIGMGTVNYIYLLRGEIINNMSHTTENGVHNIYKRNPFGKKIFEVDLYYGYEALNQLYEDQADLIISDITTYYNTKLIDEIVIVGGGAPKVFNYLPWKQTILYPKLPWIEDENGINDGQFAGVRGAEKVVKNLRWAESEVIEIIAR